MASFHCRSDLVSERGLALLTAERAHWLGTPGQLMRASRHYERAAQTLIGRAVLTSQQQIAAKPDVTASISLSAVTVECPARLDFAGGWSDTPPLCYENGGAVVNASITINGRLPIGARVRRRPEFVSLDNSALNFGYSLNHFCNFLVLM